MFWESSWKLDFYLKLVIDLQSYVSHTVLIILPFRNQTWGRPSKSFKLPYVYSDNHKKMEYEDNIITILKCIWCCYKANSFQWHLLDHLFSEMGLYILHCPVAVVHLTFLR